MRILLVDNNDSFSYNLLHLIKSVCVDKDTVEIRSKDRININEVDNFDRIVFSPGSGIPSESDILGDIVRRYEKDIPILGICLGHQAIAETYGAILYNLSKPVHGIQSEVKITDHTDLFQEMTPSIMAGRYHSWAVSNKNLPECLKVTATDCQGNIMALSHKQYAVYGVQFHPESFMTKYGEAIMHNFIQKNLR